MVESAPLLREYALKAYRGFESLTLRHIKKPTLCESGVGFFLLGAPPPQLFFNWPSGLCGNLRSMYICVFNDALFVIII